MFVFIPLFVFCCTWLGFLLFVSAVSSVFLIFASVAFGSHTVFRWPITFCIGVILILEICTYSLVRWVVKICEWAFLARGGQLHYHRQMLAAPDYATWDRCAKELDVVAHREKWKTKIENPHYHPLMVQTATQRLKAAREKGDLGQLLHILNPCLVKNFGGIMNYDLYTKSFSGTKRVVEEHIQEIITTLQWLADLDLSEDLHQKRLELLQHAKLTFGNTALMLSGGAMLGVYHWGVMKALIEQDMLPSIISGTSAGSVLAAYLACRTNEEAIEDMKLLPPLHCSKGPMYGSMWWRLKRIFTQGYLYEDEAWVDRLQFFTKGMTFQEAFNRTGRIINITCTPAKCQVRGHPPMMLSHITTPNVTLASAVLASSSVPMLVRPPILMEKTADGKIRPYQVHHTDETLVHMRDGSFESDVPVQSICEMFNVHYTIVSQVNPHIIPFFYNAKGQAGKPTRWRERSGGWRGGFLLSFLELWLKEDMLKNLKVLASMNLLIDVFGVDWGYIWLQERKGDITIVPDATLMDYVRFAHNLRTEDEFWEKVRGGEISTWLNMSLISNRMTVQNTLDRALKRFVGNELKGI